MRTEIAEEWARRLDSGEYDQGMGFLRQVHPVPDMPDRFCCWGVLCDMAVEAGVVTRELAPDQLAYTYITTIRTANTGRLSSKGSEMPPGEVYEWAGIRPPDGSMESWTKGLASLNDNGASFTVIAERIRRHGVNGLAHDPENDPELDRYRDRVGSISEYDLD